MKTFRCASCGSEVKWGVHPSGRPQPVNLDGSDHWDKCSGERHKKKVKQAIQRKEKKHEVEGNMLFKFEHYKTKAIKGKGFIESEWVRHLAHGCLPWEECNK
jgi:Holliday junction resolvase RusA-like endonuclease